MAVNTPIVLPGVIARACQLAQSGPQGPVFLSIPTEMLIEAMPADAPAASALPLPPAASAEGLDQLAEALAQARAPLIITEELGRNPRAVGELVALADTLGAPVVEAWQPYYINFPRHHPLYGGIAVGEMEALVREADFVLLVESVAPWHPASALPGPGIPVAAIGADPLNVHLPVWNYRTDLVITGDAEAALRGLTERLRLRLPKGAPRPRVAALSARHAARRQKIRSEGEAAGTQKTIENRWVGHVLNQVLPGNAILVNETITHRLDLISAFDRQEAGQYFEASYGGLGLGLSIGLGIKAAQPQRPVVIAVGDGAFHYNPVIATFGAAQEHQLPVLVLLFNNAGYRSQKGDVIMEYPEGFAVRSGRFAGTSIRPRPDYALLAQAYGGYGQQVDSPAALREALERALAAVGRGQFALIDIVQPAVNPQEGG
jgi:thiamine pyrophosphate-dependent acetolactate synthase large subunit-like protein